MTTAGWALNWLVALGYFHYVVFIALDVYRNKINRAAQWTFTFPLLGIFLTCGLHHFDHGAHILYEGRQPGPYELPILVVQAAFELVWVYLRYEAEFGGKGDRKLNTANASVRYSVIPAVWATAIIVGMVTTGSRLVHAPGLYPNVAVFALYVVIAKRLIQNQLSRKGNWSLSGTVMSGYFFNCALSHLAVAFYISQDRYQADWHMLAVDSLSIVPAAWFLYGSAFLAARNGRRVRYDVLKRNHPEARPLDVLTSSDTPANHPT